MTFQGSTKKKIRLDLAVVELGLFETRQEAQTAIMDGAVLVNNEKVTKPGVSVSTQDKIELRSGFVKQRYVSRGGLKLEKAIEEFQLNVSNRICLDVGASTGGFTDCLLQNGATLVYAIDVGYGQLDWKLRNDERVIIKERINARHLTKEELYGGDPRTADLATVDCSFISLSKILPALNDILNEEKAELICLVKPQFEAGRESVKKGVVRDKSVQKKVLHDVATAALQLGLQTHDCTYSPIKGPKGNIEFLLYLKRESRKNPEQQVPKSLDQNVELKLDRAVEDAAANLSSINESE